MYVTVVCTATRNMSFSSGTATMQCLAIVVSIKATRSLDRRIALGQSSTRLCAVNPITVLDYVVLTLRWCMGEANAKEKSSISARSALALTSAGLEYNQVH